MILRWRKMDGIPTVPNIPGPYRLFFYSFDGHEPPHVHVRRERMVGRDTKSRDRMCLK